MKTKLPNPKLASRAAIARGAIIEALDILKRIQAQLYIENNVEAWLVITRVYEHVAREL